MSEQSSAGLMNPVPYMETLQRIAAGMGPQRGFQSSLNSLLSLLTERHGFLRPHLVIFDPETRTLRLCVADGAPRSAQVVYEPGMGVTGQVFVTGKPVIVECLKGHPVFLSKFFMRTDEELSSLAFLSVPVLAPQMSWEPGREQARKVIGVLSVDTPRASREELERQRCFLEVVAGMIAAQATYLQDDMARQQRLAERRGDRPHVAGDLDGGILAVSESMCEALKQASYAGHGRGPVLLRGEPGTGKARVAAFIHTASVRNELPLVRFYASRLQSPGADRLTEEQAERELFGYRKGAFPGAVQTRKGLFELANCSTLFIEDIDKLSLSTQAQILHVLQEQSVVRMGGGQPSVGGYVPQGVRRGLGAHSGAHFNTGTGTSFAIPVAGQCRRAGPVHEARRTRLRRSRPARRSLAPIPPDVWGQPGGVAVQRCGGALRTGTAH